MVPWTKVQGTILTRREQKHMGTYDKFSTDQKLEKEGITLDLGEAGKFQLARAGGANKRFALRFQALTKPYRRAIQTESLDEETSNRILREVYVDTVLLGWSGVSGPDGKELAFSKENAMKVLSDLPWLFEEIRRAAEDASIFRLIVMEADAGN